TDVFTIGTTFWKPVTCFGSASTVYFEFLPSGGSVEKTSAACTLPWSSRVYAEIEASGTKVTALIPYCFLYPTRHVLRVWHSGNAANLKLPTFFRSGIDLRRYFLAVALVTATTSVSKKGVALRTVNPLPASSLRARAVVLAAVFGEKLWWNT